MIKNVYSWFSGIYGQSLHEYLKGFDCNGDLNNANLYITIGLVTFFIVLLTTLLYYFVRHASFNKIGSWFIVMAVVSMINLFWGFGYVNNQYNNSMPEWAIYGASNCMGPTDENGDEVVNCTCDELIPVEGAVEQITPTTCWQFGLANMLLSVCLFIILSIIVKRWSTDCQHTPWESIWPRK